MKGSELSNLLKKHDLGDDLFDRENMIFDPDKAAVKRKDINAARQYAMDTFGKRYLDNVGTLYPKGDCNLFHFIFMGRMAEYLLFNCDYISAAVGVAYGDWEKGGGHMWGYIVEDKDDGPDIVFINWGEEVEDPTFKGDGSIAL
jgi:hypothetical protein